MFQALSGCRDMKVTKPSRGWRTALEDRNRRTQGWESLPSRLLDYAFVRLVEQVKKKILQEQNLDLEGIFLYSSTGDIKGFVPNCCYVLGIVFCLGIVWFIPQRDCIGRLYCVHFIEDKVKAQRRWAIHAQVISEAELHSVTESRHD